MRPTKLDRRQFLGSSSVALLAATAAPRLASAQLSDSPVFNKVASPADVTAWLEPALQFVREWMPHQMRVTEQPGCAIAVTHQGRVVYEAAFGSANLKARTALTPRHRFRIASHSKTFTVTALMKLRERGAVRLDDAVGKYVKNLNAQIADRTIEELISNTAGIVRDGWENSYWVARRDFPDAAELRKDFQQPPILEGTSRLKYSNHGFALAGMVIEAAAGEPYNAYLAREVVQAAGLKETSPEITPESKAALAQGHSDKAALGRRIVYPGDQSTRALSPATGFVSTASDLCRFFAQLSPHAQTSILSPESRRAMAHARWKDAFASADAWYGIGTTVGKQKNWEWFGHGGGFLGYTTRTCVVPSQDIAVSVLTNAADGSASAWINGILNIFQRFQADPKPPTASADWSGRWWYDWGPVNFQRMGDKVLMCSPGSADPLEKCAELTVVGPDEAVISEASSFASYGERVKLIRDGGGRPTACVIAGSRYLREDQFVKELRARYPESSIA